MTIANLQSFIVDFFNAYNCKVQNKDFGVIEVELTEELDKALMNRPFYWHYMKSLNQQGVPMSLTLITDPEKREMKGEWIDIGSPRLQQIFNHVTSNERYVLLFQEVEAEVNTALYPWLLINFKISYSGRQKKEELISLGIQLLNGKMIVNMMDELDKLTLKQKISDLCYTITPIITLSSGYKRLEKIILNYIDNQPKEWVDEAISTLNEEIALLKHFYQDDLDDDILKKEIEELNNRYTPEITIEVISGGVVYLLDNYPDV